MINHNHHNPRELTQGYHKSVCANVICDGSSGGSTCPFGVRMLPLPWLLLVLLELELLLLHGMLREDFDKLMHCVGDAEECEEEHKQFLAHVGQGAVRGTPWQGCAWGMPLRNSLHILPELPVPLRQPVRRLHSQQMRPKSPRTLLRALQGCANWSTMLVRLT